MRITSVLLLSCLTLSSLHAQQKFTDEIQQQHEGEGQLTLHQSQEITDLVNGTAKPAAKPATTAPAGKVQHDDTIPQIQPVIVDSTATEAGPRTRINGFRIQVYSGDNTRKGKSEAKYYGQRVRNLYADLPVYISFVSPHWLCRVGDFRTNEEALEYLRQMRETGVFDEAIIVKCKVMVKL